MLKADLHVHTRYSFDCSSSLERIIQRCQQVGINCVAIADHGTVEGALKLKEIAPFRVIVAEEILTPYGEIMGMFLTKTIPQGSVKDSIARIREQGGLVNVPHPFDKMPRNGLGHHIDDELATQIDILEVFNSRSPVSPGEKAVPFAEKYGLAKSGGSDAHTIGEIGNAFVEIPEFTDQSDFLQALRQGRVYGKKASPFVHIGSIVARIKKPF